MIGGRIVLKETPEFAVFVENGWKRLRSKALNYDFNMANGFHATWGADKKDDPDYSVLGPFLADIEITDICRRGSCSYCYKSNTVNGDKGNMSFDTFKRVIEKINVNQTLTQVAFGLGSAGNENPDLWEMCDWLRSQYIIPNGTVADIGDETARLIREKFGACAVSAHTDWVDWLMVLKNSVAKLADMEKIGGHELPPSAKRLQINCHFVLSRNTLQALYELIFHWQMDREQGGPLAYLNAVVLLGLKECGRAASGKHIRLSGEDFKGVVKKFKKEKLNFGMDSCSAGRYINTIREMQKEELKEDLKDSVTEDDIEKKTKESNKRLAYEMMMVEPCESGLFSIYSNVEGNIYPCSFSERPEFECDLLSSDTDFLDYWNVKNKPWREDLLDIRRQCPIYKEFDAG
jgi:hypothetical protein